MSLTVLVTGATGFLGSHLVQAFLDEGYQVLILKRSFSRTSRIDKFLSQCIVYDIDKCQLTQPFEDFNKIDAIFHTATCYGRNQELASEIVESNVLFPLKLMEIATSNTGTFFNTDTALSGYLNSYSLSKKHFLEWGKQFAKRRAIKFINLKLEHIFGFGDDESKFVTYLIRSCLRNVECIDLTMGDQMRDFIHIDAVIDVYKFLLKKISTLTDYYQEYSVGSGKAIPVRHLVELIHRLTGSNTNLNFGTLQYRDGEIMFSEADLKPLANVGFTSHSSLDEGLQKTIQLERLIDFNKSFNL